MDSSESHVVVDMDMSDDGSQSPCSSNVNMSEIYVKSDLSFDQNKKNSSRNSSSGSSASGSVSPAKSETLTSTCPNKSRVKAENSHSHQRRHSTSDSDAHSSVKKRMKTKRRSKDRMASRIEKKRRHLSRPSRGSRGSSTNSEAHEQCCDKKADSKRLHERRRHRSITRHRNRDRSSSIKRHRSRTQSHSSHRRYSSRRSSSRSRRSHRSRERNARCRRRSRSHSMEKHRVQREALEKLEEMSKNGELDLSKVSITEIMKTIVVPRQFRSNQQQALRYQMSELKKRIEQLTGVKVPSFYTVGAVNPLTYAEQIRKRKLLWSTSKNSDTSTTKVGRAITECQDEKTAEKFRKLMGMKGEINESGTAEDTQEIFKKQAEAFEAFDKEYEFARLATHTHRGIGLGFVSHSTDASFTVNKK